MEITPEKKAIVITSIFNPTEAVMAFAAMKDYQLIVVGDKKTPAGWHCDGVTYLSVDEQVNAESKLADVLPFNHYSRKMLGYIHAIKQGSSFIIDTDDDNIPKDGWAFPAFSGVFGSLQQDLGFVNIYQLYSEQKIWPRGLPLSLINKDFGLKEKLFSDTSTIGFWQGLADEDPDVDAIYRLTSDVPCYFTDRSPVVLKEGTICPFNSQNTIARKEVFPLLYLPTYVTFRFTDILRGLVAQPVMWAAGLRLGFTNATVVQKRNPHDYMKDFISEIPMYQHCEEVVNIANKVVRSESSITDNLYNVYSALENSSIVEKREMITLEAWIQDIKSW